MQALEVVLENILSQCKLSLPVTCLQRIIYYYYRLGVHIL